MKTDSPETKQLFADWFRENPGTKNPPDLTKREKFNYAMRIGFDKHRAMVNARKQGLAWTKSEYWKPKICPNCSTANVDRSWCGGCEALL